MAVTVLIPTTLRAYTERKSEIDLDGNTVGEVLQKLVTLYPDSKKSLFDEDGKPRSFVNVFLGETNIKNLNGLDSATKDGDTIMLIPAIAGGSPVDESVIPDERTTELSNDEIKRYSRHLLLPEVGVDGQEKLKAAKVLIVGLGGLGAPLAQYLAAAGVGTLGLLDFDNVEVSNLQRQIIHGTRDVGRPKVASARDTIKSINPYVNVTMHNFALTRENALDLFAEYDIIADGTDNYNTRYLVNDACVLLGKPNVSAAIYQFEGQASVYFAKRGPCYRCVYPSPPPPGLVPSCGEGGVIGVLPGIIGTIQANEIIKLIIGGGHSLVGRLLHFDAWNMKFRELKLEKNPDCPICGKNPSITKLDSIDYEEFCGLKKKKEEDAEVASIEPKELKRRIDAGEKINIVDIREPHERAIVKFPNAIVIPIGQLARRQDELDASVDTVFICKEGKRSILAVHTIQEAGYKGACFNLKEGINGWSKDVDPTVPQY